MFVHNSYNVEQFSQISKSTYIPQNLPAGPILRTSVYLVQVTITRTSLYQHRCHQAMGTDITKSQA